MPKIKLKKESPKADTLFVSSKSDPRIKAYQDSLSLFKRNPSSETLNEVLKYGQYKKSSPIVKGKKIQPIKRYMPDLEMMAMLDISNTPYTIVQPAITDKNKDELYADENNVVRDKKTGDRVVSDVRVYKKPVQPVVYKEEVKEVVKESTPVKSEPIQKPLMQYDGEPVYHHTALGDKGIIGFVKDGKMTKISPEDFDRFAVPKETRQLILNQEAVDKYMESRLGKYYKR